MPRGRPAPLEDLALDAAGGPGGRAASAGSVIAIKNTFLEVAANAGPPVSPGPSTAPASLHWPGNLRRSLEAAAEGLKLQPEACGGLGTEPSTPTTASTAPPTPAGDSIWPPTPATPRLPLALAELTNGERASPSSTPDLPEDVDNATRRLPLALVELTDSDGAATPDQWEDADYWGQELGWAGWVDTNEVVGGSVPWWPASAYDHQRAFAGGPMPKCAPPAAPAPRELPGRPDDEPSTTPPPHLPV